MPGRGLTIYISEKIAPSSAKKAYGTGVIVKRPSCLHKDGP